MADLIDVKRGGSLVMVAGLSLPERLRDLFKVALSAAVIAISGDASAAESMKELAASSSAGASGAAIGSPRGTKAAPFVVEAFETAEDAQDKELSKEQRRIEIRNNNWALVMSGVMLATALAQAGFFIWQLVLMRDSLDDTAKAAKAAQESADLARDTLHLTQRAYVTSPNIKPAIEWPGKTISSIHFSVQLENKGTTPATNVLVYVDDRLIPIAEADDQSFQWVEPEIPAPKWLTSGVSMTTKPRRISIEDLMAVFRGEKAYILYGECRYVDVFGKAHRLETCMRLEIFVNPLELKKNVESPPPPFWRWQVYHRNNYSD